jgi:hypothetical protein
VLPLPLSALRSAKPVLANPFNGSRAVSLTLDPHALALQFARSAFQHACLVCGWDETLAASAEGAPPPIR